MAPYVDENTSIELPSITDLKDTDFIRRENSLDLAQSLDVITPWLSASEKFSGQKRRYVEEYMKYARVEVKNAVVACGVSLKIQVDLEIIDVNAKVSSLPLIAASCTLGMCSSALEISARYAYSVQCVYLFC